MKICGQQWTPSVPLTKGDNGGLGARARNRELPRLMVTRRDLLCGSADLFQSGHYTALPADLGIGVENSLFRFSCLSGPCRGLSPQHKTGMET
ncbi:hypothetical protein RRG08_023984 [Elysia crispata]|uniref:Uncharacterized protein n=1 Tax=Elysia crispata TaxID=231223 RepID=A0AAE0YNZ5_9GAST|nr:hypothetical protein RRG08_023984 [Elysia crispata]